MNIKVVFKTLGRIFKVLAFLLVFPLIVSFIYKENTYYAFLITMAILLALGFLLTSIFKTDDNSIYSKEGLVIVGLSWIFMSLIGCLPFVISKQIPNYINALFETISGFTTTGASILDDPSSLTNSMLFYRSFTHFIGGMGVLVFVLAILPKQDGQGFNLYKAESTGPQVGKLVSKLKNSVRILYVIYLFLTGLEIVSLILAKMPVFDSIVTAFATAGTGGFASTTASIGYYNNTCQIIVSIFMFIFAINFNIFYLLLIGKFAQAFKNEEFLTFICIVILSTILITVNIFNSYESLALALKDSFFQVSSIISTTGFATTNFINWPLFSKVILFILMFIGGSAGSTAGGIKVCRIIILFKSIKNDFSKLLHRNSIKKVKLSGEVVDDSVCKNVSSYFALIMILLVVGTLILSLDSNINSFETAFTSVVTCINNVGPGLTQEIGPAGNFAFLSWFSKVTLMLEMLIGRLEIYPLIILFNIKIWQK